MKLISFIIPCYNSESYLARCLDSLLINVKEIEVIVVNDGSKDNTLKIAKGYQKKYPDTIKIIDKENGGHGSGVNAGLKEATGKYFKVVDSDDWLDTYALKKLIKVIKEYDKKKENVDMYVANYVYNHLNDNSKKVMSFRNVFPNEQIVSWNDIGSFKTSQYLIMHALVYKTSILRECNLVLPEHTFYVDNIVAYVPLPYVKDICYLDLDLYQYFIGREDQSVNEQNMIKRVDQQIKVTKIIATYYDLELIKEKSYKLYKYMLNMISMMMTISSIYLLMAKDEESINKREELWNYVKDSNSKLYKKLKYFRLAGFTYLPTKLGSYISLTGYKVARKIYKFN